MLHRKESFEELIAPLSTHDFSSNYWEKTFLHQHNEANRFAHYFSLRDIDSWVTSKTGNIYLTPPEGVEGITRIHQSREISIGLLYAAFVKGYSLVLDPLEDWPSLTGLVKALGRHFHAEIGVKAYLSSEGARMFPPHTAGQDLLILHLEGEEIWNLHEFSLLQLNPPHKKDLKFPTEWRNRTKTPVIAELCLKPGDLLFIPRGMPYQKVAQNGTCFHLYISITPFFWMDFLRIAAECAALHSKEIRTALPPGFVESEEVREQIRLNFHNVMKAFQEVTSFDEVLAAVSRDRAKLQGFPPDGHFANLVGIEPLSNDSIVERRRGVLCTVDEVIDIDQKPRSIIFFGTEHLSGPPHLLRAMEFIRDHNTFRVLDLPGLDAQGQLMLIRRLVTEGLLRIVPATEHNNFPEEATEAKTVIPHSY